MAAGIVVQRKRKEGFVRGLSSLCAFVSVLTTIGIVWTLVSETVVFFRDVGIGEFLFGTRWSPVIEPRAFGILPLFAGTMLVAIGAALLAVPIGLFVAIYLSEYAAPGVRRWVKPVLELLAGIPTIVYGFFALFFVTPLIQRYLLPDLPTFNALSACIVVAIMILPTIASLSEDALRSVPQSLREGGLAMGATKGEVIRSIVVRGAFSGIMSSVLLAISRAVGETMAVTLAAGMQPNLTVNPTETIQTMSAFIVQLAKGDTPRGTTEYQTIYAVGLTLFAITLVMNLMAARLVKRFRYNYG